MVDQPGGLAMDVPLTIPTTPSKRKRDDGLNSDHLQGRSASTDADVAMSDDATVDKDELNGYVPSLNPGLNPAIRTRVEFQDSLSILLSYDTEPSLLRLSVQDKADSISESSRISKKARTDMGWTIEGRIKSGYYDTIDHLSADISDASDYILSRGNLEDNHVVDRDLFYTKKTTLIQAAESMLFRTSARSAATGKRSQNRQPSNRRLPDRRFMNHFAPQNTGNSLLTVLVGGPVPRPAFSSAQIGRKVSASILPGTTSTSSVAMPISESSLPPSISVTHIIHPASSSYNPPIRKFGDLFKATVKTLDLGPPKPARLMTTRGNVLSFLPPENLVRHDRAEGYNWTREPQATGKWLRYGGLSEPYDNPSIDAKRRQRDRALSISEIAEEENQSPLAWETKAREDALFRTAFSSFAPSVDNLDAIVPAETKAEYWWYKYGRRKYESPAVRPEVEKPEADMPASVDSLLDPRLLEGLLEDFDPAEAEKYEEQQRAKKETDVEFMLSDISDMLQTIYSYQRIRHSSLSQSLASITGTPTTPTTSEKNMYLSLRRRLAETIAKLPPYALAKINGDQLDDLAVSTVIPVKLENRPGLLEEDPISRIVRAMSHNSVTAQSPITASHPNTVSSGRVLPPVTASHPIQFPPSPAYPGATPSRAQSGPVYAGGSPMPPHHPNRGPSVPQFQSPTALPPQHLTSTPRSGFGPIPALTRPGYNPAVSSPSPQLIQPPPMQHVQLIQPVLSGSPLVNGQQYYPGGSASQHAQSLPGTATGLQFSRSSSPLKSMTGPNSAHGGLPMMSNGAVYAATTGANTPVHHRPLLPGAPSLLPPGQMHPHQQPHMISYIQPRPGAVQLQSAGSGPSSAGSAPTHLHHGQHPHPHQHLHSLNGSQSFSHTMSQPPSAIMSTVSGPPSSASMSGPMTTGSMSSISMSSIGSQQPPTPRIHQPVQLPPHASPTAGPATGPLPPQSQAQAQRHPGHQSHPPHPHFSGTSVPG